MTRTLLSIALTLGLGLAVAGCSNSDRNSGSANSPAGSAANPGPTPAPGTPQGGTQTSPTVAGLTGDPDVEVDPALQAQVQAAFAQGIDDDPLGF